MMNKAKLGVDTQGKDFLMDVDTLIESRLLATANSGGGKSWLLRRLLEQTHGKVQQIIIDIEGEFASLREKHDYIIVGKGGDIEIDLKIAGILPKKLLEAGISTIIDISELKQHERILFVKRFLEQLMQLPRKYWKPLLVIIDETNQFCPEKSKSESGPAVIDLMTRGRKRGYTGIMATQRLSKLNKDSAAEANNVLIGRTGLDIDMKRAADTLGFSSKQDMLALRTLEPGHFYAFGPAFPPGITEIIVGDVKTNHPKIGNKTTIYAPKPTAFVQKILDQLKDIQTDAAKELQNEADYKAEIKRLRTELTKANRGINEELIKKQGYALGFQEGKKAVPPPKTIIETITKPDEELLADVSKAVSLLNKHLGKPREISKARKLVPESQYERATPKMNTQAVTVEQNSQIMNGNGKLPKAEGLIYGFLMQNPERSFTRVQIGSMTGYSPRSGGFNNSIGKLNSAGLIVRNSDATIRVNIENMQPDLVPPGEKYNLDLLKKRLGKCENEILAVLMESPEEEISREELASRTQSQYSPTSGGFNNSIGKLRSLGCLIRGPGTVKLSEDIKEMMNQ
jgi:DNA-binding response OmpR family regulator